MRALATHNDASQLASLPRFLAYASGLTDNLPPNAPPRCTHVRPKPSLKMRLLCLASVVGLVGTSFAPPNNASSYFTTESPIAKTGLLANIGPNGTKSSGAKAGIVIASPNRDNPDYLFSWVRDSSLVFKVITDQFTRGEDNSLRGLIDDFFAAEAALQQVTNPSGTVATGGLGEPKFNIDGSAFTGSWGRPQRDGPALRSTALITYANWLLDHNNSTFVKNYMWPVIQRDLDYVATFWDQSTFDLWEEVFSFSFFTTAVQHRALREGAALAAQIGFKVAYRKYSTQADNVLCFLQTYYIPKEGYIAANTGGCRSGKDSNTVLASIHTWDITAGCDPITFQPCSDKALSNLKVYVDSFRSIYPINSGINATSAVAVGRYPEDKYYNGNPWYLSTFAVAEQLYDALLTWNLIVIGSYPSNSRQYSQLTSAIKHFADGFVEIAANYTPSAGGLAEQFDKKTGKPLSAADLTWSYASVLTAYSAYAGVKPPSWGAKGLIVPSKCLPPPQINVTFNVNATTFFGQNIFLVGSLDTLQDWSADNAILMDPKNYPIWSANVTLPQNAGMQYKYIRKYLNDVNWEPGPNRVLGTGNANMTVNDSWRW
ncbi:glucoamylase [Russula vinacea]|nr:glucoamylase [Russula vinacea]